MIRRRLAHWRGAPVRDEVSVRFFPAWQRVARPAGDGGLDAPLDILRHHPPMRAACLERTHRRFALPERHRPKHRRMLHDRPAAKKPRRAHELRGDRNVGEEETRDHEPRTETEAGEVEDARSHGSSGSHLTFYIGLCRDTTMSKVRITPQVLRALNAIMSSEERELSGAAIGKEANLPSGTLYPILLRLERAGWLKSRWEKGDPSELGRPRRRFYQVTAKGAAHAREEAAQLVGIVGRLAVT